MNKLPCTSPITITLDRVINHWSCRGKSHRCETPTWAGWSVTRVSSECASSPFVSLRSSPSTRLASWWRDAPGWCTSRIWVSGLGCDGGCSGRNYYDFSALYVFKVWVVGDVMKISLFLYFSESSFVPWGVITCVVIPCIMSLIHSGTLPSPQSTCKLKWISPLKFLQTNSNDRDNLKLKFIYRII